MEEDTGSRQDLVSRLLESHRILNTKLSAFECGPGRWYRGLGSIHIDRGG
jgi:hypothetical protein